MPHRHVQGAELTTARRMKQKLPFPEEKGGLMDYYYGLSLWDRVSCQGHLVCLALQGCMENGRSLSHVHCTKPVWNSTSTNFKQGDKVWVKKSFKKINKKVAEAGEAAVGPLIVPRNYQPANQPHKPHFSSSLMKFFLHCQRLYLFLDTYHRKVKDSFTLRAEQELRFTFRNEMWWKTFTRPHLL